MQAIRARAAAAVALTMDEMSDTPACEPTPAPAQTSGGALASAATPTAAATAAPAGGEAAGGVLTVRAGNVTVQCNNDGALAVQSVPCAPPARAARASKGMASAGADAGTAVVVGAAGGASEAGGRQRLELPPGSHTLKASGCTLRLNVSRGKARPAGPPVALGDAAIRSAISAPLRREEAN